VLDARGSDPYNTSMTEKRRIVSAFPDPNEQWGEGYLDQYGERVPPDSEEYEEYDKARRLERLMAGKKRKTVKVKPLPTVTPRTIALVHRVNAYGINDLFDLHRLTLGN